MSTLFHVLNDEEIEKKSKDPCRGKIWRASTNRFVDADTGRVFESTQLKILKRRSCPGCSDCGWIFEALFDEVSADCHAILESVQDGKLYKIHVTSSYDAYSGDYDSEVSFKEHKE